MLQENTIFLPVLSDSTFVNPLKLTPGNGTDGAQSKVHPDPYVLKHQGEYYAFATGAKGVLVLHSIDLVNWTHLGYAFQLEGRKGYWAPAVVYENGKFYMYVSSMPEEADDVHLQRLLVAEADRPEGPYEMRRTLYDTFSIDAHVVKDEQGDYYLFYSNNEYAGVDAERPGTVILVDKLVDMVTPSGHPQIVVVPTLDEEIYEENRFGDGRDWHTIEGACYVRRGDKHYVIYSGNAYVRPNYFLGYSVAKGQDGAGLRELVWNKFPSDQEYQPLLRRNEGVEGVGHNSVVRGLNNVDDWVFYHGRDAHDTLDFNKEQRTMRSDRLLWSGDEMWIPGPTYTEQDAPSMPAVRDLFNKEQLEAHWKTEGGEWKAAQGVLTQRERSGEAALLTTEQFGAKRMEIHLSWNHDHRGGLYGVYPCYQEVDSYTACLLDVGQKRLRLYAVVQGVKLPEASKLLPPGFNYEASHFLRIEQAGENYAVWLDDVKMLEASFPIYEGYAGLYTKFTSANYYSVEITRHLEYKRSLAAGAASHIRRIHGKGQLACCMEQMLGTSPASRSEWLVDLPAHSGASYQFQLDLTPGHRSREAGIYGFYESAEHYVALMLDHSSNMLRVVQQLNGEESILEARQLPGDFDWSQPHTLSSVFRGGKLMLRMDRDIVYCGSVSLSQGTPGIILTGNAVIEYLQLTELGK
ncbi:glycoside hydrolase family 43 protein [Paenibacillus antibioticophila]|uniref:glycoside hydrolase family 43 protein n=1 Tax=Paenibacillus antibioticophila TaxID=1274374 RepID=UPI000677F6B9|nr:glycoside hydrolase family 43 protein [Paenibacillus antibioticophila]